MAIVEIYGKKLEIRDFICSNRKYDEIKTLPSVRLYVRVTNTCNSNCKFCLNCSNKTISYINKDKLGDVIRYLASKDILNAITLTGGEPMLNYKELNDVINYIYSILPNIRISISTNGTNLTKFLEFDNIDKIDAIHISRHHYNDKINSEILGCEAVTLEEIEKFQAKLKNKNQVIINSIMMKGYLESLDDVKIMCEHISKIGIKKIHFVSLIDYNEYSRERYIDIRDVFENATSNQNFYKDFDRYRKDFCECHTYKYISNEGYSINILARTVSSNNSDYIEQLVFTNDNKLITGFDSDEVLY